MQFRSPINSSSDAAPHSPLHCAPFNVDALNSYAASPTARGKSRPRLAKLRKQSSSQHGRSQNRTTAAVAVGFSPFHTDQGAVKRETHFTSQRPANEIMYKIEEAAKPLGLNVHKRNYKMKLQGDK